MLLAHRVAGARKHSLVPFCGKLSGLLECSDIKGDLVLVSLVPLKLSLKLAEAGKVTVTLTYCLMTLLSTIGRWLNRYVALHYP